MVCRFVVITISILAAAGPVFSQSLSSNLPIVVINSDFEIVDEPKVGAGMKIIYNGPGQINNYSDITNPASLNYDGRIAIEIRGSSSQASPKKSYGFETRQSDNVNNRNVSLLGMPSENDWILNGLIFDPSLMHDYLAYAMFRNAGHYASRTVYCEVFVNSEYRGIYMLQEKIKVDGNRVDLVDLEITDNATPNITGGYIIKADKTTGGDPVAFVMNGNNLNGYNETIDFIHDTPEPGVITGQQGAYIESVFRDLESKTDANNASVTDGFPSIVDIPTFLDYMLVSEIGSSIDAYKYSTFFHKDRNGKLRVGPVWDFNYGFGIVGGEIDARSRVTDWQFENGSNEGPRFFRQMFYNPEYRCYLSKRWNTLTQAGMPLNINVLHNEIESVKSIITAAAARDEARWHTIGNFDNRIIYLKQFIQDRSTWMTNNLGPFAGCANPSMPQLVINEIMYNSPAGPAGVSNDLEFIEIKNQGSSRVNLSGLYFAGLGLSYQFPANSTVDAGGFVVIASNTSAFATKYGFQPFGQFTRNLSNRSQRLLLSDAFGNIIDDVTYSDTAPWPTSADGGGKSLELKTPLYDNTNAANWAVRSSAGGSPGTDNFGALPVNFISFHAFMENDRVTLLWKVTEEMDVAHYAVEAARDGKHFEQLGELDAGRKAEYMFTHQAVTAGRTYYRLKSIDTDGSFAYSKIIIVRRDLAEQINIYPNPATDKITFDLSGSWRNGAMVELISLNGQKLRFLNIAEGQTGQLSVATLPTGKYILQFRRLNDIVSKLIHVVR
ncbi:CotH kinase family protein [Dyadobacter aurulentus]|uniref:CotH kinase family protein n=1 Tax=Dyadobacter sp. UC 10 TaxID=2605428 RepID=UPI0011F1858A|nr:CotH kinase family protein [Dyadobacter sp. UC 10]KAA0993252.1 T9SS type A sorting domain-containing protein [Dyadobacter sp. UC 10]